MIRNIITTFLLTALFLQPEGLFAQQPERTFKQDDVFVIFTKEKNKARRDSISTQGIKLYKPYFALTPFIGYNPAYGVLIGVGSSIGLFLGDPLTTPISSASVVVNFTSKSQKIINIRTNVITDKCRFILRGDWRFMIFSQTTYGLGSGLKRSGDEGIILGESGQPDSHSGESQPLFYDYLRFYETFYLKIVGKFYIGMGYYLDDFSKVVDKNLHLDSVPPQLTSHYKYSTEHGFNLEHQALSGLSLELLYDSRNNSIRPTKGFFGNLALRDNSTFLGSSRESLMLNSEFRTYVSLSKRRPEHLIGFWYLGQFTQHGRVPYLGLPAIGWDMYNRAGRGYIQGSIRGVDFVYGETEYRFPISRYTGILGGVLFVNATTASSDDQTRKLFEYIDPAAGAGIRIMFNRKTLSNLTIDCGFGKNGSIGVYFNLNETF